MQNSIQRMDGVAKVTGRLRFSSDLVLPSMLYAVPVLSDQAHAKIVRVDDSEAKKLPGCVKVYTGRDVPNNRVGYYHDHRHLRRQGSLLWRYRRGGGRRDGGDCPSGRPSCSSRI